MATLAHPLGSEDLDNKNAVKVITNQHSEAIYFSRFAIPYSRAHEESGAALKTAMKHIGLYGYTRRFLQKFCSSPQAAIEKYESLEQLRALYLGAKIKVLQVEKPTYGVDTPEDLQKLEALLK
jgi:3-deoxy-manno-octulosonate cytidylyltransferase (CMP-KDO synthetase)